MMNFQSTRDANQAKFTSAQVIRKGLADDGGLFVPESIPTLSYQEINDLCSLDYAHRAAFILGKYLTDYSHEELLEDCQKAYREDSFVGGAAPLHHVRDNVYTQELWHGPTAAFKDMALQIMPRLLSRALKKTGEQRKALILVATSGDTGKAALEGYRDVDQVCISVFYPVNGVSKIQKLQMVTQQGENVNVCAIHGNFDDAQSGVKAIFSDYEFSKELSERGVFLSSANSINWGRLVPQIVYYVSAYCDMINDGAITLGERIDVCVPTGNFGNIFAGFIAKKMGLPIEKLVCASNKNNVLTDFLTTGVYDRNRSFFATTSPSMDILISSNLERLLYTLFGAEATADYMCSLNTTGRYELKASELALVNESFVGYYTDEEMTARTIRDTYKNKNCLIDTHTAVAVCAAERFMEDYKTERKMLTVSTASPYKFAADVYRAISGSDPSGDLEALFELHDLTGSEIPNPISDIMDRNIIHTSVINKEEMKDSTRQFALS